MRNSNRDIKEIQGILPKDICMQFKEEMQRREAIPHRLDPQALESCIQSVGYLVCNRAGGNSAMRMLYEIDIALCGGRLLLDHIGLDTMLWALITERYTYASIYMYHAVPEAFNIPRIVERKINLEKFPEVKLQMREERIMDKNGVPRVRIESLLIMPNDSLYQLATFDDHVLGDSGRRRKEFFADLMESAEWQVEFSEKKNRILA